jgi:hypothetical protein
MSRSNTATTWLGQILAGVFLGLLLALVCAALFAWFGPGGIDATDKTQVVMWLIVPIWLAALAWAFSFASAAQAWRRLGLLTFVLYGLFFALHGMRWSLT